MNVGFDNRSSRAVYIGIARSSGSPGPVWLYLISRTLAQGRRAGYFSMFGVAAGLSLHATFAAFGLTVVLLAVPFAFDAIKLAGAAYLLWLAYTTVRGAGFTFTPQPLEPVRDRVLLRQAFIAAVINPRWRCSICRSSRNLSIRLQDPCSPRACCSARFRSALRR